MSPMVSSPFDIEHALLGFLREEPTYPYRIYRALSEGPGLGRVWHLKQSLLYALLSRLEASGYIRTTTEQRGGRPPRKVMSLTPSGRAAFDRWLATPVAHGRDFRLEFLAKLYFVRRDGPAAASLIAEQREACESWLADLRAQAASLPGDRQYDWLVLQFRIHQIDAIVPWLDLCAATLRSPTPA